MHLPCAGHPWRFEGFQSLHTPPLGRMYDASKSYSTAAQIIKLVFGPGSDELGDPSSFWLPLSTRACSEFKSLVTMHQWWRLVQFLMQVFPFLFETSFPGPLSSESSPELPIMLCLQNPRLFSRLLFQILPTYAYNSFPKPSHIFRYSNDSILISVLS